MLNDINCSVELSFRHTHRFEPVKAIAIQLLRFPFSVIRRPTDLAIEVQPCKVHSTSEHGESRVVERLVGLCVTPASDGEVSDGGAILGADDGEECVHGRSVFDSEGVAGV